MAVSFKLDLRPLQQFRRGVNQAAARAVNKSSVSARAVGARAVSQNLGVRVGDIRKELVITNATAETVEAKITVRGRRLPLILFNATGPEPSRGQGRGVSYRLGRTRRLLSRGFITTLRGGHRGVFRRLGKGRLPIVQLFGPSLPLVFVRRPVEKAMRDKFAEVMPKNLAHEVEFELRRAAGRLARS